MPVADQIPQDVLVAENDSRNPLNLLGSVVGVHEQIVKERSEYESISSDDDSSFSSFDSEFSINDNNIDSKLYELEEIYLELSGKIIFLY